MLNKIEEINHKLAPFPEGTLLVSWDVISMYPSINNEMGISACKRALDERTTLSPSTECLLEAIKIALDCNNSSFKNKHYRQNRGTATGPHYACSYADLAMTEIDHKILNHDDRPKDLVCPPDWSRFRDDCFSPWFGSHDDLVRFTDWLNSLSPGIKFTVKQSDKQLKVLDTLLFIINGPIESKVYSKPTDGHMYLLPQTSHYRSMYLHIPFGVALRIKRICSQEDWFDEQLLEYKQYFKRRNYKKCVIQKRFDEARNIPRSQALKPKTASDQIVRNFALFLDYHPNFNGLPLLIRDHLKILFESPRMRKVFSQDKTCIRTGFRRYACQIICATMLLGCFKCHRKVYDACQNFLLPYRCIINVATGKSYKIRQHLFCPTDFIIYGAFGKKCNRQCVGSAIDFRRRLSNYKSHIKKEKEHVDLLTISLIIVVDHPLDCLKFTLIEQVSNNTEKDLEEGEGYWQAQLWTFEPF